MSFYLCIYSLLWIRGLVSRIMPYLLVTPEPHRCHRTNKMEPGDSICFKRDSFCCICNIFVYIVIFITQLLNAFGVNLQFVSVGKWSSSTTANPTEWRQPSCHGSKLSVPPLCNWQDNKKQTKEIKLKMPSSIWSVSYLCILYQSGTFIIKDRVALK